MLETISENEKVYNSDKSVVLIKGNENPKLKGFVFKTDTEEIIGSSFSDVEVVEYTPEKFKEYYSLPGEKTTTVCYEGPLVKVKVNIDGSYEFYNNNKLDCRKSFWGDKTERFEELFLKYGGQKFVTEIEKNPSVVHHFMIMTPSLMTTTRADFKDNECLVIYLGSVSLDGTILNPNVFSPEIYHYNKLNYPSIFPTKAEAKNKIIVPTRLTQEAAEHILINGYDTNTYSESFDKSSFIGECIILRVNHRKIIKFTPKCYQLRTLIAGSTPNVKNRLYNILELAKDPEKYDQFPVLGTLENECLGAIKQESKKDTTKMVETFLETFDNYIERDISSMMNNILLVSILSCPLTKINKLIDAWFDYCSCKDTILKFIKEKNSKIRSGFYDNRLLECHNKALERIKNMALVSKNYASQEKNGHTYASKLEYSIKGLVRNEFGPSLYRIERAIKFLKENSEKQESVSMEM